MEKEYSMQMAQKIIEWDERYEEFADVFSEFIKIACEPIDDLKSLSIEPIENEILITFLGKRASLKYEFGISEQGLGFGIIRLFKIQKINNEEEYQLINSFQFDRLANVRSLDNDNQNWFWSIAPENAKKFLKLILYYTSRF